MRSLLFALAAALRLAAAPDLPTVVVCPLPSEATARAAFIVPTSSDWALEINFPYPVADWAGRGFTPDPERYAGDFMIDATRGATRLYVTALAPNAHRVLHVALDAGGDRPQTVPLELVPTAAGQALRKLTFVADPPPAAKDPTLPRAASIRPAHAASPRSEVALLRLARLLEALPLGEAERLSRASPALQFRPLQQAPADLGDFTIRPRFVVSDAVTGTAAVVAEVASARTERLLIDPRSWLVRSGDLVVPVATVDPAGVIEPGACLSVVLILAPGPDGGVLPLAPGQPLSVTAVLGDRSSARPVHTYDVNPILPAG